MADQITDKISETALGPARVSADGVTVEAQPIPDQIAADKYLKAKTAKTRNHLGLTFRKLEPGGCG